MGGTGPCSDPPWVARTCSVPGLMSLKMPEPGKKPGSSGPVGGLPTEQGGWGSYK